ncbi:MAG: histidinol dehydrogenase [Deltaproteobacteria bacterium]|nr:histidinol dehydrogenase [Deltaproteobacteria bacterium]
MLKRRKAGEIRAETLDPVDAETLAQVDPILAEVREEGEPALRRWAERLGDRQPGEPLVIGREALEAALAALDEERRGVLERTAARIEHFARAQAEGLRALEVAIEGGRAGLRLVPVERAGCYAPGGRYPLPSSVLMTAITARVAGVREVWVASPRPAPETLAAAALAGADALLAVGGAQAIAALAHGAGEVPACDAIVGPGNRWVTAAKARVAGRVAIDMLAGPSELLVLADAGADPALVAADLLAQAEHDPDALPVLVALDAAVAEAVDGELERQLRDLPTAGVARQALARGFTVEAADLEEAIALCDRLAPEHLALHLRDAASLRERFYHCGALFVGGSSAEVLGDYGAGPNHVLPTGGSARSRGALSVLTFLRAQTWLDFDLQAGARVAEDAEALARIEGLEAHARAAGRRGRSRQRPTGSGS